MEMGRRHIKEEGNLRADDLAKKGIASDREEWQEYGISISSDNTSFIVMSG